MASGDGSPLAVATGGGVYELGDALVLGGYASLAAGGRLSCVWHCAGARLSPLEHVHAAAGGAPAALPDHVLSTLELGLGLHVVALELGRDGEALDTAHVEVRVIEPGLPTLAPRAAPAFLFRPERAPADVLVEARAADRRGLPTQLAARVGPSDGRLAVVAVEARRGLVHLRLQPGTGALRYEIDVTATDEEGRASTARAHVLAPPRGLTRTRAAP